MTANRTIHIFISVNFALGWFPIATFRRDDFFFFF